MPLNKLENFVKNTEGRILYVNPNDLDSTDSITNQGNSLTKPFKTIQRALLESARFSYLRGNNNDIVEKTTILLFPGEYVVDNRPGYAIKEVNDQAQAISPNGESFSAINELSLTLDSVFDLTDPDNILYKFNSIYGGVVVPRGTSIVGLDLRKTKIRAKYIPNPTDPNADKSAIFRITGACYFWQLSFFDASSSGLVYTDPVDFSSNNQSKPTFSHHKLTCFEYADGVNIPQGYQISDLNMYYSKLSNAFNQDSGRNIDQKYPDNAVFDDPLGFAAQRPEYEIVGAFATDSIIITEIISGDGYVPSVVVTVTTQDKHNLSSGTPIKIKGVSVDDYNISTIVQNVLSPYKFTYLLASFRDNLIATPSATSVQTVTIETDTVSGASPYIFNCSLRSVWGMNGMHADGSKASGFRSMVVAQFTGVSLQKDDRAFVKYDKSSRLYNSITLNTQTGSDLAKYSSSQNSDKVYHLDSGAIYRDGWGPTHIKISNDAFIQVVSVFAIGFNQHFEVLSGGDASITNSNSNFGQISLVSGGFRRDAFNKDDQGYITSIINPRSITNKETLVDWISLDIEKTINIGISSHLYLFGFEAEDDLPPIIIQGFRVGAKKNDELFVQVDDTTTRQAPIYMVDEISAGIAKGTTSSEKSYKVTSGPANNVLTFGEVHKLKTSEKVRIFSENGDLPENIFNETIYYAITSEVDGTLNAFEIKLAASKTNAESNVAINIYGGSNLTIVSRVSDKISGDEGFPVQYDSLNQNWYIHSSTNNDIYTEFVSQGVGVLGSRSNVSYFKRIQDNRGLEENLYKMRVSIPQNAINSKNPTPSFIIQESSTTGIGSNGYVTADNIKKSDYLYKKNERFITNCAVVGTAISVTTEIPHNLEEGDIVRILSATSTTNLTGEDNIGFNGLFEVSTINGSNVFTCGEGLVDIFNESHNTGTYTGINTSRGATTARFERNDNGRNFYIYRSDTLQEYDFENQDGLYHFTVLNSDNSIQTEFTDLKYSQNIVDLYPQLDRDNINDNPQASTTFAKRNPLGEIVTNDQRNSITRETVDKFLPTFGIGKIITNVETSFPTANAGICTITVDRDHGFNGIATYTSLTPGSGHIDGTYYGVRLYNNPALTVWKGATGKVVISGGSLASVDILTPGSFYSGSNTLYIDYNVTGGGSANSFITVDDTTIYNNIGDGIQITGLGKTTDGYSKIATLPLANKVSIAITSADPTPIVGQYIYPVGPSLTISGTPIHNASVGITTITTTYPHGLFAGNKVRIYDSNNNNKGDYLIKERISTTSFNIQSDISHSSSTYVIKHGLSSNDAISDRSEENISIRNSHFYGNQVAKLEQDITNEDSFVISLPNSETGILSRFKLGSYILIGNEIMRVAANELVGVGFNELAVLRGLFGTRTQNHSSGSLIRKINVYPIEIRRPSIVRASGHTFEYLGFGPGNYSTSLPFLTNRSLTEREEFLAQSQERSGGTVVYTGMNNDGDFYIGNTKYSASSGTQKTFDIPIPTVTAQDPNRSSVVFDEVRVKERLVVDGGNSKTVLSQFDGPVTFDNLVKVNDDTTINANLKIAVNTEIGEPVNSTSFDTGALVVEGGVGIEQNLYVGELARILSGQESTSKDTGALVVEGGLGVEKNTYIGGSVGIANSLTVDQELRVVGVATFVNDIYIGGALSVAPPESGEPTLINNNLVISGITTAQSLSLTTGAIGSEPGAIYSSGNGSGNFLIRNTFNDGDLKLQVTNASGTVKDALILQYESCTAQINGDLCVTDDITAFYSSDERLKNDIKPIDDPLAKVLSISGNTFSWNEDSNHEGEDVGVIAQEIESLGLPGLVTTRDTGYKAVRYEKLVPLLVEAIKELSEKVEALEQKLSDK